jgi:RND family efflux transporter MFP subunit
MPRNMQRLFAITAIMAVAIAAAVLLARMKTEPEKKPVEDLATLVEVMPLETATADFAVASQGTVRPRTETTLSAEVSGGIVSVSPKLVAGGLFAPGDELLRIDPARYEAAVEQAEALLHQRQIEFDGAQKLQSKGYRAEAEFASAGAALAIAKASLVTARRDLEHTRIRLPYGGMVRSKDVDIGQFVTVGTKLALVFATDYAEVRLPLTDFDQAFVELPRISQRDSGVGPAVLLTARYRGRKESWEARITRSEGVVDEQTRVTYAVARIDDPYRLRPEHAGGVPLPIGTFVTAHIDGTSVDNVMRIPREALRGRDELLFVDNDNRLRIRTVDVLRADAEYAWLSGGASPGDRIVLTKMDSPINGMRVRIADDSEADALASSDGQALDE